MPVGVPKVLYYWDDELPLQWIDLYNLIFRRRLVFVMSELDQNLCNQIAGMMVYIHFADKRKELEKTGVNVVDLFEQPTSINSDKSNIDENKSSNKLTYQDLLDSDNIWDLFSGVQKDYYMDLYNSNFSEEQKIFSDYLEHPLSFSNSNKNCSFNDVQNLFQMKSEKFFDSKNPQFFNKNILNNSSNPILKQYSNLFNIWFPLLPLLLSNSGGKYFTSLNKQFPEQFSSEIKNLQNLFFQNQMPSFEKINCANEKNISEKSFIYQSLKNYLDWFQHSNNDNFVFNSILRDCFKQSVKKAYYQDSKDQTIRNVSTYVRSLEESQLIKNLQQKKSPDSDYLFSQTLETIRDQTRVFVFINSTGGSVTSGITIYDALQFVKAGAVTVCLGMAFSASSMVLAGGNLGHRYVSEGSHVMIHQPEGGIQSKASDVILDAHEILRVRRQAATIYTLASKRAFHEVLKDLDRDSFMTPQEAIDYGLADEIVTRYSSEWILNEFEQDWLGDDVKQIEGFSKKIQQSQEDDESTLAGSDQKK